MIIFCPESFTNQISPSPSRLAKGFVKFYASETKHKMIIANEVWETFRFKLLKDSSEQKNAYSLIFGLRSIFKPEEVLLDDHKEIEAKNEYSKEEMIKKTKDLIKRNYLDVEAVVTTSPEKFKDIPIDINYMNIEQFYDYCIKTEKYREMIIRYWRMIQFDKANGGY